MSASHTSIVLSPSIYFRLDDGQTVTAQSIRITDDGLMTATVTAGETKRVLYGGEPRFFPSVGIINLEDVIIPPVELGTMGGGNQAVLSLQIHTG